MPRECLASVISLRKRRAVYGVPVRKQIIKRPLARLRAAAARLGYTLPAPASRSKALICITVESDAGSVSLA